MERPPTQSRCVAAGRHGTVLAEIARPEINLALWRRRLPASLAAGLAAADLTAFRQFEAVVPLGDVAATAAGLAGAGLPEELARRLAADAAGLAARLAAITATGRIVLRVERITGDACRRFHADYIRARLIVTYRGRGTQWLSPDDAAAVTEGRAPPGAAIGEIAPGWVAMMKGRLWSAERPLVHRSPPIAGSGQDRLVLVLDEAPGRS